jgi:hypothetical protein
MLTGQKSGSASRRGIGPLATVLEAADISPYYTLTTVHMSGKSRTTIVATSKGHDDEKRHSPFFHAPGPLG